MRTYDTPEEVHDELNKIWNDDLDAASYGSRLFTVTFYASVKGVWRRCIAGPVDAALATQLLCADDDSFAIEEVRRVMLGDSVLVYPELQIW